MKQKFFLGFLLFLVLSLIVSMSVFFFLSSNKAVSVETNYEIEIAFPNLTFDRPVGLYHPGDGTNRLFVIEQKGVIYVFENSENVTSAQVFLDITDHVNFGGEQGLLGLAFHPNFTENGYFYVDYTASNPRRTIISRFSLNPTNPNQANDTSELLLLEIAQPYANHNGGQIAFGFDDYLYIAMGDGGSGGDPLGHGQDRSTLLGSILRIDVNNPSNGLNYGIPSDNPFVGNSENYREEIYAYGLRNPWRFSFDPVTNWLWTADVGQDAWEEIDIIEKGKNYGWNIMEGNHCYSPAGDCNSTGLEPPVFEYSHQTGASITGGFVYRGSRLTDLVGSYIYADYVFGQIWALSHDGVSNTTNRLLVSTNLLISSFGIDQYNELYICTFDGKIYQLRTEAPIITLLSPTNSTYSTTTDIWLNFTIDEDNVSWVGYSLDGDVNVTITGDLLLSSLSEGSHYITVFANDTQGNMGRSPTIWFTIGEMTTITSSITTSGTNTATTAGTSQETVSTPGFIIVSSVGFIVVVLIKFKRKKDNGN
ncbi:MAG: PQQ-dependent sugar dehydrogenase [Candidatus Hodarchaeota archaeon]